MRKTNQALIYLLSTSILLFLTGDLISKDKNYKLINIEEISRLYENRIAFQHIEHKTDQGIENDDSVASLLIINEHQVYLMRDGFDDPGQVKDKYFGYELTKRMHGSLWTNKINSKPDYIRITEGRIERLLNVTEEFVQKNFGAFYANVRNSFIDKHVKIFEKLMIDRVDSQLKITRTPLTPPFLLGTELDKEAIYATTVTAKTLDDKIYYAEDKDGDEITETFSVNLSDGFHWGYQTGPNIVYIYQNTQTDIRQLIGQIIKKAYYGTDEEEKIILANFPPDKDIMELHGLKKVDVKVPEKGKGATPAKTP